MTRDHSHYMLLPQPLVCQVASLSGGALRGGGVRAVRSRIMLGLFEGCGALWLGCSMSEREAAACACV